MQLWLRRFLLEARAPDLFMLRGCRVVIVVAASARGFRPLLEPKYYLVQKVPVLMLAAWSAGTYSNRAKTCIL